MNSPDSWSVSVVVPVFNEIELVDASVRAIDRFLSANIGDYEIVIIESGSTDGSGDACDRLAVGLPSVKLIHEGARRGMGAALRLGYATATKDLVLLVTVDMPFPLEALLTALPLMTHCQCVLSYRSNDTRGLLRKIQSWVFNTLVKSMLGLPMRTINSAFKLYRRDVLSALPLISNGWFLDTEVLYWIARRGYRYREIPVPLLMRQAGESKVGPKDVVWMLWELIAFRRSLKNTADRT